MSIQREQCKAIAALCLTMCKRSRPITVKNAIGERVARFPALAGTFAPIKHMRSLKAIQRVLEDIAANGEITRVYPTPHNSNKSLLNDNASRIRLLENVLRYYQYDEVTGALTRRAVNGTRYENAVAVDPNSGSRYVYVCGRRYSASLICWLRHFGQFPSGEVAIRRGAASLAIKNIYIKESSR